jgi:YjgF/chorismate_mutase-like, putative endoribonuclease
MARMQRNGDPARASVVITLDLEADPVHGTLDMIVSVVRPIGHISAAPGFVEAPRVLDGASRLLVELFGEERGGHARMALYPPALPTHAPLTAELLLEIDEVVRPHDSASN